MESAGADGVPSVVVGSGVNISARWRDVDVRAKYGLTPPYVLYVGRIDRNKGVDRLLDYYREIAREWPEAPPLVLAGPPTLEVPPHPKVLAVGVVSDEEKHALIAGAAVNRERTTVKDRETWENVAVPPGSVNKRPRRRRVFNSSRRTDLGGFFHRAIASDVQRHSAKGDLPAASRNAAFMDSLGWVLYRQGRLEEARQELEQAVEQLAAYARPRSWTTRLVLRWRPDLPASWWLSEGQRNTLQRRLYPCVQRAAQWRQLWLPEDARFIMA